MVAVHTLCCCGRDRSRLDDNAEKSGYMPTRSARPLSCTRRCDLVDESIVMQSSLTAQPPLGEGLGLRFAGANYGRTSAAFKDTSEAVACATLHSIGSSRPKLRWFCVTSGALCFRISACPDGSPLATLGVRHRPCRDGKQRSEKRK